MEPELIAVLCKCTNRQSIGKNAPICYNTLLIYFTTLQKFGIVQCTYNIYVLITCASVQVGRSSTKNAVSNYLASIFISAITNHPHQILPPAGYFTDAFDILFIKNE